MHREEVLNLGLLGIIPFQERQGKILNNKRFSATKMCQKEA